MRIWSHSLKKSLMEKFIFCAVIPYIYLTRVHHLAKWNAVVLINKLLKWNLSQAFPKALTSAQKLYGKTTIFDERLPMTASALKSRYHYNKKRQKHKTILIWRSSRKMNRSKNLLIKLAQFSNAQKEKRFPCFFFFNFVPQLIPNFLFMIPF